MMGLGPLQASSAGGFLQGQSKKGKPHEAYIFDLKSDRFAQELEAAVNVSVFPELRSYTDTCLSMTGAQCSTLRHASVM